MKTQIKAPFATVRKTANVPGVFQSRFKIPECLVHAKSIFDANASPRADTAGRRIFASARSDRSVRLQSVSANSWALLAIRNRNQKAMSMFDYSR
jgi:hypothetical protein